ncbi:hypothetical protein TRVA0_001S05512 [Trichomonascus vanleenenianus]|uniref:Ugx2p n=1 Tax=Trichomonascus vanleenenianus TaxID=2268995 RepID=UPI003ECB419F
MSASSSYQNTPLITHITEFLSKSMLEDAKYNAYEIGEDIDGCKRYSVSVRESQGFRWNLDLFVSRYHQRSGVNYLCDDEEDDVPVTEISPDDGEIFVME